MRKHFLIAALAVLASLLTAPQARAVEDFPLYTDDTQPYYPGQAIDRYNVVVDLTGATGTAVMWETTTGAFAFTAGTVTITNPSLGLYEYRWADTDTNTPGAYAIVFRFVRGGKRFSFPAGSTARVIIKPIGL